MNTSKQPSSLSLSTTIWKQGFATIKQLKTQLFFICCTCFFIPNFIFELKFGKISADIVSFFSQSTSNPQGREFSQEILWTTDFINNYSISLVLLALLQYLALLAIIHLSLNYLYKGNLIPLLDCFKVAFKKATKILLALIIVGFLILIIQSFSFLSAIISSLCLFVPIILMKKEAGILAAIDEAIFLKFVSAKEGLSKFNSFIHVISTGLIFYFYLLLIKTTFHVNNVIGDYLEIPRQFWTFQILNKQTIMLSTSFLALILTAGGIGIFTVILCTTYRVLSESKQIFSSISSGDNHTTEPQ